MLADVRKYRTPLAFLLFCRKWSWYRDRTILPVLVFCAWSRRDAKWGSLHAGS